MSATMLHESADARAFRAVRRMNSMLPQFTSFARAISGRPDIRVAIDAGTPRTDGKTIWLRPPMSLGDVHQHDRINCGRRDRESSTQICPACRQIEDVQATLYHEIAHIVFATFDSLREVDKAALIQRAVTERPGLSGTRLAKLQTAFQNLPDRTSYIGVSKLVSPYLPTLINALEDARVNRQMYEALSGTWHMFKSTAWQVLTNGIETFDGSVQRWSERPENAQALIGCYCLASGWDVTDHLAPAVSVALEDSDLRLLLDSVSTARTAAAIYRLAFPVLERLRELGFCKRPEDIEDDPPPPPPPQDTPPSDSPESQSGDSDDPSDDTADDDDDDDDSGDAQPNDDADDADDADDDDSGDDADSDDAGGDGVDSDDEADDDDDDSDSGNDAGDDADGEADDDDADKSDAPGDADQSDAPGDAGDDSNAGDDSDDDDEEGDGAPGGSTDDDDADADDIDTSDDDDDDDDDSGDAGHGPDSSDRDDAADERMSEDPDDADNDLRYFGGHDAEQNDPDEAEERQIMERAVQQAGDFDEFSNAVRGVNVHSHRHPDERGTRMAWQKLIPGSSQSSYRGSTMIGDFETPESMLGPTLLKLRAVFADNKKAKRTPEMRSGRIVSNRLPSVMTGNPKVFARTMLPGKKDYLVVLALDVSGSTVGSTLGDIKRMGMALGSLLSRSGVKFAIYAHSGASAVPGGSSYRGSGEAYLMTDVFVVKEENDPWDTEAKQALADLNACNTNLDGHMLEFLRKRCDRSSATNKIILYVTDGAMPDNNLEDELRVLTREIKTCAKAGYTLVGVGMGTDSPTKHGLPTVHVDSTADIPNLIRELERRLTNGK